MDRLSFMAAIWKKRLGLNVTAYPKSSRKNSTNNQQQIAWKRLQSWLRNHPGKLVNDRTILEYLIHLQNSNLRAVTIKNYAASLSKPLKMGYKLDLKSSVFRDLIDSFSSQPTYYALSTSLGIGEGVDPARIRAIQ